MLPPIDRQSQNKLKRLEFLRPTINDALVAQLDRALDYESRGREFESSRARHFLPIYTDSYHIKVSVCSQKTSVLTHI